jgi:hypothetical protein
MNRRLVLMTLAIALVAGTAFAAKTYKYKCNKCKLIQEYGSPGVKKCPNDGSIMIRQN